MTDNKRIAGAFLILGMVFLTIGISTDNTAFSWAAIAMIVISLTLGGRRMRPRKR